MTGPPYEGGRVLNRARKGGWPSLPKSENLEKGAKKKKAAAAPFGRKGTTAGAPMGKQKDLWPATGELVRRKKKKREIH